MLNVDTDDWLRREMDILTLERRNGSAWTPIAGKYFLGLDQVTYWRINETNPQKIKANATSYSAVDPNLKATKTNEKKFALAYIDQDGAQVGLAWEKNGGSAITGTCWVSVTPRLG